MYFGLVPGASGVGALCAHAMRSVNWQSLCYAPRRAEFPVWLTLGVAALGRSFSALYRIRIALPSRRGRRAAPRRASGLYAHGPADALLRRHRLPRCSAARLIATVVWLEPVRRLRSGPTTEKPSKDKAPTKRHPARPAPDEEVAPLQDLRACGSARRRSPMYSSTCGCVMISSRKSLAGRHSARLLPRATTSLLNAPPDEQRGLADQLAGAERRDRAPSRCTMNVTGEHDVEAVGPLAGAEQRRAGVDLEELEARGELGALRRRRTAGTAGSCASSDRRAGRARSAARRASTSPCVASTLDSVLRSMRSSSASAIAVTVAERG